MVFHCRCLSFSFQGEEIEHETATPQRSNVTASAQTFYTASSNFNSLTNSLSKFKEFTISEVKAATNNFSRSAKIGEGGGVECVYMGVIGNPRDSTKTLDVAVKKLGRAGLEGIKEWVKEVNILGVAEHPNLVKLVGYCAEDDERLLVYEYMPNRSVKDQLSTRSKAPLSWTRRLKVARDVACGLTYLHEQMDFQILFKDLKSSNVLLDDQLNAKLSGFGLARRGPEEDDAHVAQGTKGYMAPEFILTGHLSPKSDVWSYGVFLYELITGRDPRDWRRPPSTNVIDLIGSFTVSKRSELIIDPRLEGNYSLESTQKLCYIAKRCLARSPKLRPKMGEVLEMVNQLIIGVQSEATPLDCPASVVHLEPKMVEKTSENMTSVEPKMVEETLENMKSVGETGSTEIQRKESGCFSRIFCFQDPVK